MSKTILIACKLPHGLALQGMGGESDVVKLNGANSAMVDGAPGLTHVEETQAQYLMSAYAEHSAFKNNAVYSYGTDSVSDITDMTGDLADNKTGLEGLDANKPAPGLLADDPKALEKARAEAERKPRPTKGVAKADKAAAAQIAAELRKQ